MQIASCFRNFARFFRKNFHPLQQGQQGNAQHVAHQQLRAAYGESVEGKHAGEGGGEARLIPGQQCPHDKAVADHGGQGCQPPVFAPGGEKARQQGGQGAENQIRQPVGAEKVGEHAPGED